MYYKIKNLDVNCEIIGTGKPIIIIHGYTVDYKLMMGCMEPVFKEINEYRRIYIDLPGMGKTKGKDWITNSDIVLEIVTEFIEKVIPSENFLLVGESYGGYLSRGILHKMKERVDGLFLLCPAIITSSPKCNIPAHIVLEKDEEFLLQLESGEVENFKSIQVVQTSKVWKRYNEEILHGIRLADNNFLMKLKKNGYALSFEEDMLKEKYNKPTLLLLGRQDSIVGYKDALNILENYPRATFAVLDKAGHNLQIEQEELFNALVYEWLKRVN